jgi:hypothetical protein
VFFFGKKLVSFTTFLKPKQNRVYMKRLSLPIVCILLSLANIAADDNESNVQWVLMISKEAAHKVEPRNSIPQPMDRKLAELLVRETTDRHKLSLLTVYAFAEGAYSLDPALPGDCKGLPAGTPKCTTRMIEEGILCCDIQHARHFCTLQVEPKPVTLEECVQRASVIMQKDLDTCPNYPGSVYATGSICGYSYRIDWRARIAKKLEVMELSQ